MSSEKLIQSLDTFIERYITQNSERLTEFDSDWLSPCAPSNATDGDWVTWKPVKQTDNNSFDDMEGALSIRMNDQLKAYYSCFYADHLDAQTERGNLTLLQVWNKDDFERLQQNLIGHVLMKRKLKQAITLFFAMTDEEDFIISVINDTGEVALEQVGKEPQEILAPDLATFIANLTPRDSAQP